MHNEIDLVQNIIFPEFVITQLVHYLTPARSIRLAKVKTLIFLRSTAPLHIEAEAPIRPRKTSRIRQNTGQLGEITEATRSA